MTDDIELPDWPIAKQFKSLDDVIATLQCAKRENGTLVAACWVAAKLLQNLAAAQKDAARYRYIKDTPYIPEVFAGIKGYALKSGDDLDSAIDAAMAKVEK
jgi:hypothetical protein